MDAASFPPEALYSPCSPTLLLNPPVAPRRGLITPPMGLLYLAGALRDNGLDVRVCDARALGLSADETMARVAALRPEVLGMSVLSPLCLEIYDWAARLRPYVRTLVLGGPHCTAVGASVLRECPHADVLVRGEGEHAFSALVKELQQRGLEHIRLPGVTSRVWDGGIAPHPDLDSLPWPARDLVYPATYSHPLATSLPMATVISSRGCTGSCSFCTHSLSPAAWRPRRIDLLMDELAFLQQQGNRYIAFYDDDFTADPYRIEALCRCMKASRLSLEWKCEARADQVDGGLLRAMASAGCQTVAFGIETLSPVALRMARKGILPEQALNAVRAASDVGLEVVVYLLVGLPGQTPDDCLADVHAVASAGATILQLSTVSLDPGSRLFEEARARRWLSHGDVRSPYDAETARATLVPEGWTTEMLSATLKAATLRFYRHPSVVWRLARRSARLERATALLHEGRRLVTWFLLGK